MHWAKLWSMIGDSRHSLVQGVRAQPVVKGNHMGEEAAETAEDWIWGEGRAFDQVSKHIKHSGRQCSLHQSERYKQMEREKN